jgi:hypothetical protein
MGLDQRDFVDASSVVKLQSLSPQHSTADLLLISDAIDNNEIFPKIKDRESRNTLRRNICSLDNSVPSLQTFFEDMKYLEPCAKVLKALLPSKTKQSVCRGLMGSYFEPPILLVEHAYNDLRTHDTRQRTATLAYQQLWLFALRNFPLMTNFTAKKVCDKDKPHAVEPSPVIWQEFGSLALSLGFKTAHASELSAQNPTKIIVDQLLGRYVECGLVDQAAKDNIARALRGLRRARGTPINPIFTGSEPLPLNERCGRPFEDDHNSDRLSLYLPQVYHSPSTGENITSFYRKWSMFRMFMDVNTVSMPENSIRFDRYLKANRHGD